MGKLDITTNICPPSKAGIPSLPSSSNPDDAGKLGVTSGDVVEVFNDYGSTFAMALPGERHQAWATPS